MTKMYLLFFCAIIFQNCSNQKAVESIVNSGIEAHGFDGLFGKTISFDFRDRSYSVFFDEGKKIYTRSHQDTKLGLVKDVLVNSTNFERYINDSLVSVDEEWSKKYSSSVNSVLYFFQLPLGLNDPAVNKKYIGQGYINGVVYEKIRVTFDQENGGEDHQDIFVYWFNEKTKMMDYLAYSYETDGGGVRFRQAINRRKIEGITFQDYINYEPTNPNIELKDLDQSFDSGELKELSRIINENIKVD